MFGLHSCLQPQLLADSFSSTCFGLLSYFCNVLRVPGSVFGDFVGNSFKNMTSKWNEYEKGVKDCLEMNTAIEVDSRRLLNNEVLIGPWIILDQRYIIVQIFDIFSFFLSFKFSFWPPYKSLFNYKSPQHPIKHSFKNMALG